MISACESIENTRSQVLFFIMRNLIDAASGRHDKGIF
jgi:hypothetical protein